MKASRQARRDATQLFRLCVVNGVLDEGKARDAVERLATEKPRGYLGTLSYFKRLVELDTAQHTAKVESAVALPAALQTSVQTSLTRAYGPGLSTAFAENPELLGGMRIQVGSDVYDGSVRARLAALERTF
jgi:F-type H+-transporting ATPase subunit delta